MDIPFGTFRHSERGLIAPIAVLHVFISCHAVGNGLNLVLAERKGPQE